MIVGITGRAGAGKDTVAAFLREDHKVATLSFAGPLKSMLCDLLKVPYDQWEDREWKEAVIPELGLTPREMAQTLGTEWGRNCCGQNFWVKIAMLKAQKILETLHETGGYDWHLAFTDVRFQNEADAIYATGGHLIHVVRPGDEDKTGFEHASEAGVAVGHRDVVVHNDGSLFELKKKCHGLAMDMDIMAKANEAI